MLSTVSVSTSVSVIFVFFDQCYGIHSALPSFPTRRSSDLTLPLLACHLSTIALNTPVHEQAFDLDRTLVRAPVCSKRSEEHTSELQSPMYLVCRLLLEKKKETPKASWPKPAVPQTLLLIVT